MLFDDDQDAVVTADELKNDPLISALLLPDLDLFDAVGQPGADGVKDSLSIGVGITCVAATYAWP